MREAWKMRKADYITAAHAHAGVLPGLAAVLHRNAVAAALGRSLPVPKAVLRDYRGTDWRNHPQYRHGPTPVDLGPSVAKSPRKSVGSFYAVGLAILQQGLTGIGDDNLVARDLPETV